MCFSHQDGCARWNSVESESLRMEYVMYCDTAKELDCAECTKHFYFLHTPAFSLFQTFGLSLLNGQRNYLIQKMGYEANDLFFVLHETKACNGLLYAVP